MQEKITREVDCFEAVSKSGTSFTITIYQVFIVVRTTSGPAHEVPSLKEARTEQGYHANYVDDNTYKIVELGIEVTRV